MRPLAALSVVLALTSGVTRWARADDRTPASEAEALFRQALVDMDAGRTKEACRKFGESMRLDPANGTLLNLARCKELEGRLPEALAAYRDAAALSRAAGQLERAAVAEAAATRIGTQLPRVRVLVVDAPPGTTISANGQALRAAISSEPFVVGPGKVQITVSAPGHTPYETTVNVPSSSQVTDLAVPPLQPSEEPSPLFWAGITTGTVGLSTLIAGAAAGAALLTDPRAADAEPKERAAIALLSVGAALGVSATVMLVLDQSAQESSPRVSSSVAVRLIGGVEAGGGRAAIAVAF